MFFSNKQGLNEGFGHWFKLANEYWSTDIRLYYLRWFGSYTSPWGFSAIRQCNFTRYNLCVWSGKNASRRARRWRFWPNKFLITKKACTVDWFFGIKCPFCLGLIVELPLEKINHRLCLSESVDWARRQSLRRNGSLCFAVKVLSWRKVESTTREVSDIPQRVRIKTVWGGVSMVCGIGIQTWLANLECRVRCLRNQAQRSSKKPWKMTFNECYC